MQDDCKQNGVCAVALGCRRHWEERNRELVNERDAMRVKLDEVVHAHEVDLTTIWAALGEHHEPPTNGARVAFEANTVREERDFLRLEADRVRVQAAGVSPATISTCIGLVNAELRARKAELRESTDLARRKRLVARLEQLRVALSELDVVAMSANALRRNGE